ncbi:hypothetical protein JB92DRAFT_2022831 [Gautieria morchelliformis]|nr:hypothetical protein JB92DRAFT_2022831 [Gautieria morchelliformis]
MPEDELAEINGILPKRVIADGEEVEARSMTSRSKSVYKVKRTWDHFYCTCPVSAVALNARSLMV